MLYMLIDMHAHSSGISTCCRIPAPEVIDAAAAAGIQGIILTNHYNKSYVTDGDFNGFARRYVEEYRFAKAHGDEKGFPVLFGVEVQMELHDRVHMLVYGVEPQFVLKHPSLFDYSQEELYRLVKAEGGAMVQAHPLRRGKNVLLDPAYLDGVEINSHPLYDGSHLDELRAFATEHGLILTSGGDYHADTHRPCCGAVLPDGIKTTDVGAYLLKVESIELCYQEPHERTCRRTVFSRKCR